MLVGTSIGSITRVEEKQTATSYSNNSLTSNTTYYWNIIAKDNHGVTTSSPIWSFTTSSDYQSQDLVQITGGTFQMGSPSNITDEMPQHSVTLSSFSMDKYEITYEKWTEVRDWGLTHGYIDLPVGQNGYNPSGTYNPVTMVYWPDAIGWCNARSEKDGLTPVYYYDYDSSVCRQTISPNSIYVKWDANGYRLPTEAEWEFAARGGTSSQGYLYSGSNTTEDVAWYFNPQITQAHLTTTHTVGTKSANELGIYDMSGNVFELCWDRFGAYSNTVQIDPKGATIGSPRVRRGGMYSSDADDCRIAKRSTIDPSTPNPNMEYYIGFRCVKK